MNSHPDNTLTDNTLIDSFGRRHNSLRLSVTDRCNIRCFYCMPAENVVFRPREELLTFEEIERLVRVAASMGVQKLRLTGGEPLVRANLDKLIRHLVVVRGIEDVALTTNGILLADQAESLRAAGLNRLNISLDTLSEETFHRLSRRSGLEKVLDGIFAAQQVGFEKIRLNAIAIRDLTEAEIIPLAKFACEHNLELRFIEFMPLDADGKWRAEEVLTGQDIRATLEQAMGPLEPLSRNDPSQPAVDYRFADGRGQIGFINPVSQPFCGNCNRLRLTAEGQLRNCLFSANEWDARAVMRSNGSDDELRRLLVDCTAAKQPAHGIGKTNFQKPDRAMYQIGG